MAAKNPNFVVEQCAIYEVVRAQAATHQEQAAAEALLHAIADENNASCAYDAALTNFRAARWDDESVGALVFIVDLMSTNNGQGTDSFKDEQGMRGEMVLSPVWVGLSLILFLIEDRTFASSVLSPVLMETADGRCGPAKGSP
ncbi:Hydroxymethylglutaryl-CoA lyase, mitochondrial [Hordeum vulgare]|nr:Hydroxymethylglutaryl-CoA lyase, mitochondrial [Hordeum vulgare]